MDSRQRLREIDLAKGIGIILVVAGHLVAGKPPAGNEWFLTFKGLLYSFHMPFFMYLSGYVFYYSGRLQTSRSEYPAYVWKLTQRLLIPFFALGIITLAGKIIFSKFMYVDNPPAGFWEGVLQMIYFTRWSPATAIWYLFVLYVYSVLMPLIGRRFETLYPVLLVAALLLWLYPLPALIYGDRVSAFLLFFLFGMVACKFRDAWEPMLKRFSLLLIAAFALALLALTQIGSPWIVLACAILGTAALHSITLHMDIERFRLLAVIGAYSLVIYLLNTITIGLTKGVLLQFFSWNYGAFFVYLPLLMAGGLLLPMIFRMFAEKFTPPVARYLR
jgi:fucose 4-O-acetylase-like acetyltransferase